MQKIVKVEHEINTADNLGHEVEANYRRMGKTEINVPFFAFGGSAISGAPNPKYPPAALTAWSNIHDDKSRASLHWWMHRRCNCFDMGGAAYGRATIDGKEIYGYSETLLGGALALTDHRRGEKLRDRATVTTKGGSVETERDGKKLPSFSWENLDYGMDCSLERLKMDSVDVFLMHGSPSEEAAARKSAEDMEKLGTRSKHYGYSLSFSPEAAPEQSEMWRKIYADYPFLDCMMIRVNLLDESYTEHVWPWAKEQDIGIIARTMLGVGKLTTRMLDVWGKDDESEELQRLRKIRDYLVNEGIAETIEEAALRYAIPFVHTGALATLSPSHLDNNIRAVMKGPLPEEAIKKVKKIRDGK
ncbi:MAG: aldo/keto reductase [Planctomycetia bacterium]|nr:aldo/keto reductase [Planctomycetia bacterium]